MELLEVHNTSDKPVTLKHDEQGDTVIPPHGKKIVPLAVATVNFGNPAARDEGRNRLREAELRHVHVWWGMYPGMFPDNAWTEHVKVPLDGSMVGPLCPPCEVYDLETQQRIWMVHDDPRGEHTLAVQLQDRLSEGGEDRFLHARINQLEAQLTKLLAIAEARGGDVGPPDETTADDDAVLAEVGAAMEQIQANAMDQSQADRNEQRDEIPPPPADDSVRKDNPRTTRSGARASAGSK